jgi:hypothetical protein
MTTMASLREQSPSHQIEFGRVRIGAIALTLICQLGVASILCTTTASAQTETLAMKNGESVQLQTVYWVANCRSIMVGRPEVEILEGPPELTLTIKEEPVLPRRFNCANKVPGGTLIATALNVTHPSEAKLVYRVKYKTKDGDRQTGKTYLLALYP